MSSRMRRMGVAALAAGLVVAGLGGVYANAADQPSPTRNQQQDKAKPAASPTERMGRGVISVPSENGTLVSWRRLAEDPEGLGFNVYRGNRKLNDVPITDSTNYFDANAGSNSDKNGDANDRYIVRPVSKGVENVAASAESLPFQGEYQDVPIEAPEGGTTPSGEEYTYNANDASVGDLDGDGEYELVLKWEPTNAKDNSQSGHTGNVFVDAYELDGTRLWRIDLGVNIRAGAHYTQFQVFDYDGDGSAEVAMKTADGTVDGEGTVIGDGAADYRNESGYVLDGPEFLTMFNGQTGAAMDTVDYVPSRGNLADWGDDYGNRADRFLAGTAYLDGSTPSLVMARGYYTRSVIAAWTWDGSALSNTWTFDSDESGSEYAGQGNHNLSIADVDQDGNDEIVYGAMAVDHDGTPMYSTGLGHGDALHVSDFLPDRDGLEVWDIHESGSTGASLRDAATGELIWTNPNDTGEEGPGRGVAGDIDPNNPGAEFWAFGGGSPDELQGADGSGVGPAPSSANFLVWWDGDAQRELLDGDHIDKYSTEGETRLLTAEGVQVPNGTKATPSLSADILGDWREEVVWPTADNTALRIYSTAEPTDISRPSLMEDRQYRVAVAWQNTAYNQPPHASFLTP